MATNEPAPDRDELAGKETYVVDGVTYTVHSAAALFPLLPPSIYEDLVADIRKHGIRQPVLVFGTEIVDGRNRVRAGLEAGVHIPIEQITDEETIYEIAASANLHRRSLVPSQRAYIAEQLHRMAVEARRERQALRDRARNRRWRQEHRGAGASPPHAGEGGDVAAPAGSAASSGGSAAAAPTAGASATGDCDSVSAPGSRADERPSSAAAPAEARGAVSAAELVRRHGSRSRPPPGRPTRRARRTCRTSRSPCRLLPAPISRAGWACRSVPWGVCARPWRRPLAWDRCCGWVNSTSGRPTWRGTSRRSFSRRRRR